MSGWLGHRLFMWEFIIHTYGIWGQLASCSRAYQEKMLLLHTWLSQPIKFTLRSPLEHLSICNRSLQEVQKCCEMFARANTLECATRRGHSLNIISINRAALSTFLLQWQGCRRVCLLFCLCITCLQVTDFENCSQPGSTSTTLKDWKKKTLKKSASWNRCW